MNRSHRDPYALHRVPTPDANHAYCMAARATLARMRRKPSLIQRVRAFLRSL